MKEKKIVKREHVSKGYTLDLEEMTLNQAKKKKKNSLVKWSLLKKAYAANRAGGKKRFREIPL